MEYAFIEPGMIDWDIWLKEYLYINQRQRKPYLSDILYINIGFHMAYLESEEWS